MFIASATGTLSQTMKRHHSSASPPDRDTVALALRLLIKEIQARLRRHPSAHLVNGRDSVEVRLRVPTVEHGDWLDEARQAASASIDEALGRLVLHRSVFRIGHVYCLRCASAHCEHSLPQRSNEVFAGYTPSGVPRFLDFGQWLLERHEPRIDQLYRSPAGLVAHQTSGQDLTASLLPAFQDADSGYHIHGQLAVGWYHFPTSDGLGSPAALTYQVVSSRPRDGRRRFGLNLIGIGPDDQPLETLFDHIGEIPWLDATRWAQAILRDVESSVRRQSSPTEEQIEKRLQGLLAGLARRLQHQRRSQDRKTRHGRSRHRERTRPTAKALADLDAAGGGRILHDTRRDTLVVLGDRGRAHVFNQSGRLVTSIHYSTVSIERRRRRGLWKPASAEQIGALRKQVALTAGNDPE